MFLSNHQPAKIRYKLTEPVVITFYNDSHRKYAAMFRTSQLELGRKRLQEARGTAHKPILCENPHDIHIKLTEVGVEDLLGIGRSVELMRVVMHSMVNI